MVLLTDRAPLERVRKLADGRIAAVARFARSGVYQYAGSELGRPDLGTVNVYRPDEEVFSQDAMASFGHKAVTFNHPADGVSAANWKQVSVGFTEGRIARDGGYVEIPLMLADAHAVSAYERGEARELSAGYECQLIWGDGIAPDGTPFQARQTHIRGNHIALVCQGRAGSACRIGDSFNSGDSSMITDAQIATFRDSAAGQEAIAYAKSCHALNGWRSGPWNDQMERQALADALAPNTRFNPISDAALADAKAQEEAAYERSVAALTARRR